MSVLISSLKIPKGQS